MRASMEQNGVSRHISGAEKIINSGQIMPCVDSLIKRGLNHEKGCADFLNIKIENVKEEDIKYLDDCRGRQLAGRS